MSKKPSESQLSIMFGEDASIRLGTFTDAKGNAVDKYRLKALESSGRSSHLWLTADQLIELQEFFSSKEGQKQIDALLDCGEACVDNGWEVVHGEYKEDTKKGRSNRRRRNDDDQDGEDEQPKQNKRGSRSKKSKDEAPAGQPDATAAMLAQLQKILQQAQS